MPTKCLYIIKNKLPCFLCFFLRLLYISVTGILHVFETRLTFYIENGF